MATIDPSIALNIRPPQIENPMNALARVMQIKGLQQDQEFGQFKMENARREIEDQNALRAALQAPGADPYNALLRSGRVKEATDFRKGQTDATKTEAEIKKLDFDTEVKKVQHVSSVLSTAKDQATYDIARSVIAQQYGEKAVANLPPQFDPNLLQARISQGMTIVDKLNDERVRQGQAITVRGQDLTAGTARRGQDITVRGQNLSDERSRERLTFDKEKDARDRSPTGGKMTESQAKANLFGSRMSESHRVLTELEGKYNPMAVNAKMTAAEAPLVGGAAGFVGNLMLSDEGQMAEQAMRDFINAVLRRESGAVISEPEFANAKKQYFPQPGDSEAVLAQKRRNRETAIRGMEAEVPGGLRSTPSLTNPGSTGGASGGWSIQKIN